MAEYGEVRDAILRQMENKDVSLKELYDMGRTSGYTAHAIRYNLKELAKKGKIVSYVVGAGFNTSEKFFSLVKSYEDPKEVLDLMEQITLEDKGKSAHAIRQMQKLYEGIKYRRNRPKLENLVLLLKSGYINEVLRVKHGTALEISYFRKYGDSEESRRNYSMLMRFIDRIQKSEDYRFASSDRLMKAAHKKF